MVLSSVQGVVFAGTPSTSLIALGVAAYGALLSSAIALRQIMRDRPRVKIIYYAPLAWSTSNPPFVFILFTVRVANEQSRPVQVENVLVRTEGGSMFHPSRIYPPEVEAAIRPMLDDGETADFHFDVLSFRKPGYMPVKVLVRSMTGRTYEKRVSRRSRRALATFINRLLERYPGATSQNELFAAEDQPTIH